VLKLIIEDDEGHKTVVPFVRDEITIGRQEGNTIRLTERNVSRRHARLVRQNGHVVVEDLGSYNGIRINGDKIAGQVPVHGGDLIQIGDYDLAVQEEGAAAQAGAPQGQHTTPPPPVLQPASPEPARPRSPLRPEPAPEPEPPVLEADAEILPDAAAAGPAPAGPPKTHQSTSIIHMDQLEGAPRAAAEDIDPSEAPRLVVLNTEMAGREFACVRTELRIGRTEENDIQIDHRSMSRMHAKLLRDQAGEWRVVDLQSANGLRINGDPYAQSALASGDVLELGHVKLRFVGAGESFRFVPETQAAETAGRGKGLWIGLAGAAVVLLAGVAVWVATHRPVTPVTKPVATVGQTNPDQPAAEPGPESHPPVKAAPKVSPAELQQKMKDARAAMDARDFPKAVGLLEGVPEDSRPADMKDALEQARVEVAAKRNLDLAQKALDGNRLDEAASLLAQAQGTLSFAKEYEKLKAKVDQAQAKAEAHKPKTQPAAAKVEQNPAEDAAKLLDEGMLLMKKKQYTQARDTLIHCLKVDKAQARCHMYLGSAYAKLKELETAARHYKAFVDLAPDDPLAPKVREIIQEYEKNKQ